MFELLMFIAGAAGGGGWVAYRLKGGRTWREVGAVILGGGPANPTTPA